MSLTIGMKRGKTVLIKKLTLVAMCWFCIGSAVAQSPLIQRPSLVQQVMNDDPALANAFGEAAGLIESRQWSAATQAWQTLFEKTRLQYGDGHIVTALILNKLANVYLEQGQQDKALLVLQKSLLMTERTLGSDHREAAEILSNLGLNFYHLAKFDKAVPLQQRAFVIYEKVLGPEHPETARGLNNLAATFSALAQYDKALPLQQRAFVIYEKVLGPEHPYTATTLNNLALTYSNLAQHDKALPLKKHVVAIYEKVLDPDHLDTATVLINLAATYSDLAQHEKALPLQQRALAIRERALGPEHPDTALSLSHLASTYSALAQHEKALPLQQRALAIHEKVLGLEHPDKARSFGNLALTYSALGLHDKALPLKQRALAINEKALGLEHPDTATSLNNLAATFSALAQHDKALPLQQRALAIYEKVLGLEHPDTAGSLSHLALTYSALAHHDKALPLQQRALAIREKVLGPEHPDTALSLSHLALTFRALAEHAKALPLQQRTLAIYEKVMGIEHPYTARSFSNLAATFSALDQHEKALPLQQRALAIHEKVLGLEHPDTARSLNNLAVTFSAIAQYDRALPLQQRVLAINEKALGPEHPDTAKSLSGLAGTYSRLALHDKALPLQVRALSITENALGRNHPDTAAHLNDLAWTLKALNHPEAAIVFYKSAVNIFQIQRERVSSIGAAELKSYSQSIAPAYQSLASVLTDLGRLDEAQLVLDMLKEDEQFEFIRRSSSADPRRSRMGYNASEQVWVNRYRQVADHLAALGAEEVALQKQAKLGLTAEQQQRQKALAADLAVARAAFDAFLNELRNSFAQKGPARSVEVVETSQQALRDMQGLLKGLGDHAVLLQYYVTDDRVGILLTTPGVQLARTSQVSAKDLNRQIGEFRRLLRDPKSNVQPAAQALYQLLVAPVAQDLAQAGAKTVMLSLDGALRYVPFAALHDGQQYLAQKWNLPMYTSVTKDKLRDAVAQEWQAAALGLTQAVGEFDALPAVRAEMRSIVKDGRTGVLPGEVHLNKAFSAARLKDVSQRPFQLLHVASHFRFSPGTEVNSFLLLGDGQQLTLGDIRTQNFRFDQVDLLTLSACDTGLGGGRDAQGREIEGFGVIAQQQGAKAVLATLWPVADQSTALLMADLYKQRQSQRLTKIEALRQAQLGLLAQPRYAHPFYWAPFILMGNWK
jgi:CHAT domain-containing protein